MSVAIALSMMVVVLPWEYFFEFIDKISGDIRIGILVNRYPGGCVRNKYRHDAFINATLAQSFFNCS